MEILDEPPPRRGRQALYPWQIWADGKRRLAVRGEDYTVSDPGFASVLRNHARRNGLTVTHWKHERGIAFQFGTRDCLGAPTGYEATCGQPGPHAAHPINIPPAALDEHQAVVKRNPHMLSPEARQQINEQLDTKYAGRNRRHVHVLGAERLPGYNPPPPNAAWHRHNGEQCLDGCPTHNGDHNCNADCATPCPHNDEDPRAWQG